MKKLFAALTVMMAMGVGLVGCKTTETKEEKKTDTQKTEKKAEKCDKEAKKAEKKAKKAEKKAKKCETKAKSCDTSEKKADKSCEPKAEEKAGEAAK